MFVELPDGENLLMRGYARAVAGDRRAVGASAESPPDMPDWLGVLISVALILIASWLLYGVVVGLFGWLLKEYNARSLWAYSVAAFCAFAIARVVFYIREVRRRWWEYPPLEIGVGLGLAAVAVRPDLHPVVNMLAFCAAVRIITDGMKRFRDFRKEVEERRKVQA